MADGLYGQFREDIATGMMRGLAPKFISGCHKSREYRLLLSQGITDRQSMVDILEGIRERMGSERINSGGLLPGLTRDGTGPADPSSS